MELEQAFLDTRFVVPSLALELKIGAYNELLIDLMSNHALREFVFITAENPMAKMLLPEENQIRTRELIRAIEKLGLPYYPGQGIGNGDWPPENSLLVLCNDRMSLIRNLGRKFDQLAVVAGTETGIPELLWKGKDY